MKKQDNNLSLQVFHHWDEGRGYDSLAWGHNYWFRENKIKLSDLFTKYDFWQVNPFFIYELIAKMELYAAEIRLQNQIKDEKAKRVPLGFDNPVKDEKALKEIKHAYGELKKMLNYRHILDRDEDKSEKLTHRDNKHLKFGAKGIADIKLSHQDEFFFYELLFFLEKQIGKRKNILKGSQIIADRKRKFVEPNHIKDTYWKPVSEFLLSLNGLLDSFGIIPLLGQTTRRERSILMVEMLELMGVDFRHGSDKENDPLAELLPEEKTERIKTMIIRANKLLKPCKSISTKHL